MLKCAALIAIHSCSLGAPILLKEAKAAGSKTSLKTAETPACDKMKSLGQWNTAWDAMFALDPAWTDEFMATAVGVYAGGVLPAKEVELLSVALDASYTHMYAPGTRRHIGSALAAGASTLIIRNVHLRIAP